jgi:hypothetical protein
MCLALALALAPSLASVVSYDHKWCFNLERHLLMTLASIINYNRIVFMIQATDVDLKKEHSEKNIF